MHLIGQQVCFHSAMKHKNDVNNMIGFLQVVKMYSFMKEIKLYTYKLFYRLSLCYVAEIKHVLHAFVLYSCENLGKA